MHDKKVGKIVAIDYGIRRIGLALSDESKRIALPWKSIEGFDSLVRTLLERRGEIEKLIVGLPLLLSGKKGEMAEKAEAFAHKLEEALGISVLLWDERLSSKHAEASLKELNVSRKKRSAKVDCTAACFLLQSYLDSNQL